MGLLSTGEMYGISLIDLITMKDASPLRSWDVERSH